MSTTPCSAIALLSTAHERVAMASRARTTSSSTYGHTTTWTCPSADPASAPRSRSHDCNDLFRLALIFATFSRAFLRYYDSFFFPVSDALFLFLHLFVSSIDRLPVMGRSCMLYRRRGSHLRISLFQFFELRAHYFLCVLDSRSGLDGLLVECFNESQRLR